MFIVACKLNKPPTAVRSGGGVEKLPLGCIASSLRHRRTADLSPTEVVTRLARGYKTDTPELVVAPAHAVSKLPAPLPPRLPACQPLWLIRCTCFQVQFEATRRSNICILHGKTSWKTCGKQAQLVVTASSILADTPLPIVCFVYGSENSFHCKYNN